MTQSKTGLILSYSATEHESQKGFSSATPAEASGTSHTSPHQTDWKQRNTRLARLNISVTQLEKSATTYWPGYPLCKIFELLLKAS